MSEVVAPKHDMPSSQTEGKHQRELPGVLARPLEECKCELESVRAGEVNRASFVRKEWYPKELEAGVNTALNLQYGIGYTYFAMSAYFDSDTVALPGISAFFRGKGHKAFACASEIGAFQNTRGGRVQMLTIPMPDTDYNHPQKGDALYGFEVALALERSAFDGMRSVHRQAEEADDFQAQDFIEAFMTKQAASIKALGDLVCELRRVGKGHGTFHLDEHLMQA